MSIPPIKELRAATEQKLLKACKNFPCTRITHQHSLLLILYLRKNNPTRSHDPRGNHESSHGESLEY